MHSINLSTLKSLLPEAKFLNCESLSNTNFTGLTSLTLASPSDISFVASKTFFNEAKTSKASLLVCSSEIAESLGDKAIVVVSKVELSTAKIIRLFFPEKQPSGKRSTQVAIDPSAKIGSNTDIGHFVTIGKDSVIGNDCIIEDGVKIGDRVHIGDGARIGKNCVFFDDTIVGKRFIVFGNSTFGGDGFGFVFADGKHNKIPQVGRVVIGDDVEVGSNCTIDRGALTDTTIGNGCKFDNMVHIAHNCKVGDHVIIAGQSGLAGSVTLGNHVIIGGACAISDHLTLVDGTIVAGGSSLRTSPKTKDVYVGWDLGLTFPEFQKYRVNIKNIVNLNKWLKRIENIEKKVGIETKES
ncbi:UDP-3-O-(3-hydroxymyristoyl)glucosamine N-acyltransferase [Leptospira selangorensis]|uniref:UDP-3-O-(3-hydroxymyristoyl)glucosamine N-acyltransferase n=1 Tax=Leptospira selangorensis TaxID=2484982 RepID=A0ABY2NG20_9LEPT|nr:UDP-3-O-(3-hydroxymyristoyl)glucosamine N-acyltransferase [Leptospira selangorensis]TGM26166.1 UDP-3-O-(3-hydroxymyristoyl)glucosamine N-acyltransferase [Leptospira selangorensis]